MIDAPVLVIILIFLPFAAAILTPFLYKLLKNKIGWWAVLIALVCMAISFMLYPEIHRHGKIAFKVSWVRSLDIDLSFYVTGLSLLFCVIVSGIGTMITAYSNYYLSTKEKLARLFIEYIH